MDLAQSNPRLLEPLSPAYPDIGAQVIYSVRYEQCLTAADFLLRWSLIGFSPDQGWAALPQVIARMDGELNWSDKRMGEEFHNYEDLLEMRDPRRILDPRVHKIL